MWVVGVGLEAGLEEKVTRRGQGLNATALKWVSAFTKAGFVHQTNSEAWFITAGNTTLFPLLHSTLSACFAPLYLRLAIAHSDLGLMSNCSAMKIHFMRLTMQVPCTNVVSTCTLELCSEPTENMWFSHATVQYSEASLCELAWSTALWLSCFCFWDASFSQN